MATLLFPFAATAAPQDEFRSIATAALVAYGTGDVATLNRLWSGQADESGRHFVIPLTATLRVRCVDLLGVSIDSRTENAVHATVTRSEAPRFAFHRNLLEAKNAPLGKSDALRAAKLPTLRPTRS